ncbi:hypothetical protein DFQ01_11431 [Paenibacillus cellulosilyticus]|uniref:Uncharacterized protein n=1 Tax=Paenibacillus cellulosilyticus TaxID=375489 RepID=A0A2V2YS24_9BACL|nr:hypothetical protein DFQ01_11431 [Paenibacillus cellulosilyticus]
MMNQACNVIPAMLKSVLHLTIGVEEDNVIFLATFLKNRAAYVLFSMGKKVTLFFLTLKI